MTEQIDAVIETIKILGSGAVGFVSALIMHRIQSKSRIVRYHTTWMRLFNVGSGSKIRVSVDRALLTGNSSDSGEQLIGDAIGHAVSFKNYGNDIVEQLHCDVTINNGAVIIDQYTLPERKPDYEIECKRDNDKTNVLNITIPYLNAGDQITAFFQSTKNNEPASCEVTSRAKGTTVKPFKDTSGWYSLAFWGALLAGAYLYYMEPIPMVGWRPQAIIELGGGRIVPESTTYVEWPWYTAALILGITLSIVIYSGWKMGSARMVTRLPWAT